MKVPDKPADPNEVELTEGNKKTPPEKNNKKRKKLIINVKITFCTHVGWDGVLVIEELEEQLEVSFVRYIFARCQIYVRTHKKSL